MTSSCEYLRSVEEEPFGGVALLFWTVRDTADEDEPDYLLSSGDHAAQDGEKDFDLLDLLFDESE